MNVQEEPLIAIENISKKFSMAENALTILDHINFNIYNGDSIAVVGASGIGKSTLLHILGTLDRPDSGSLLFEGKDLFLQPEAKLSSFRNEKVGFVFQFHHLLDDFSAIENVMMPLFIRGVDRKKAFECAENILVRVGLENRINHRSVELSGGEQQRVAIARAIVQKPVILLADEPTGNLDKRNSESIHRLLIELNDDLGMTMVIVTHNPMLSSLMSKRVTLCDAKLVNVNEKDNL